MVSGPASAEGIALIEAYDADRLNEPSRTVNISTRGFVGTGDNRLVAGFVIGGSDARRVLIRGVGPSLAAFGATGVLAEPQLVLRSSAGLVHLQAGAWTAQPDNLEIRSAAINAGAFALAEGGRDAAVVTLLNPGAWTVEVAGANNTTGDALIEVYDVP